MIDEAASPEQIRARMQGVQEFVRNFTCLVECTAPELPGCGILAGPPHLDRAALAQRRGSEHFELGDNLHFAMNVQTLLRLGFAGIEREALAAAAGLAGEPAAYLDAIAQCHAAAAGFAAAHAEEALRRPAGGDGEGGESRGREPRLERIARNCRAIAQGPPGTFEQAVQLFWFAWCLRGRGTIGRLDQHLIGLYRADLAAGRVTPDGALAVLCDLWRGLNRAGTGDTLVNLMVGGQDRDGQDATNELSGLMIDASLSVRGTEPHLSARIHARTPEWFRDKVAELQLLGHGQGAVYNDEMLIGSLVAKGVPLASARNYANDGCTEVTIDGESGIQFLQVEAAKSLELTLFNGQENVLPGEPVGRYIERREQPRRLQTRLALGYRSGDFAAMESFQQVYRAFLDQYLYQVDCKLAELSRWVRQERLAGWSSPFLAGTFPRCLAGGVDPVRGGFTVPCHMIFSGSIPTAADGLAAIRKAVFEDRACTPGELLTALRANFEGHEPLRQRCLAAPKFGNDDDSVDELAADIARRFCRRVVEHPTPTGKCFWPALYNFLFNDHAKIVGATPDGRRWGEPIAEHYSPTPGRARRGPTAVICSAAKGPLAEACGSSIFHVSLHRSAVPAGPAGREVLRRLFEGALAKGVAVMDTAIYDVQALRDAQQHPERHEDLIVRVWGFCARFVTLSQEMQDHIIRRAVEGP